jgi:hypothetical protein
MRREHLFPTSLAAAALALAAVSATAWAEAPAARVAVNVHRIEVTGKVRVLPGPAAELASLPGPLAALDVTADFDRELLRRIAWSRALADVRRQIAAEMARQLRGEERWLLRELRLPTEPPTGDSADFAVSAVFEKSSAEPSPAPVPVPAPPPPVPNDANRVAQRQMNRLFGRIPVQVMYRVDSKARQQAPVELTGKVDADLQGGEWSLLPARHLRPDEDPARALEALGDKAELAFYVAVSENQVGAEAVAGSGTIFRSTGSVSVAAYRREGTAWRQVKAVTLPELDNGGGFFSGEQSSAKFFASASDSLVRGGYLLDLCNRTFAEHFGR